MSLWELLVTVRARPVGPHRQPDHQNCQVDLNNDLELRVIQVELERDHPKKYEYLRIFIALNENSLSKQYPEPC